MNATESKPNFRFVGEGDSDLQGTPPGDISQPLDIHSKVTRLFRTRIRAAEEHLRKRTQKAFSKAVGEIAAKPQWPWEFWMDCSKYTVDLWQRAILFWDALRQRGNAFVEHEHAGKPPMLHFKHEIVLDA